MTTSTINKAKNLKHLKLAAANARAALALGERRNALAEINRIFEQGQTSLAELEALKNMLDPTSFAFRLAEDCVGSWRVQPGASNCLQSLRKNLARASDA
jgi:hypothetical protein